MPRPKKTMPVSALLLAPLIALSLVCAPVATAAPNGSEEHCTRLKKTIDSFGPNEDGLHVHHAFAQYQIHCTGTAGPSVGNVPGFGNFFQDFLDNPRKPPTPIHVPDLPRPPRPDHP
jgi:hypothetical protein